MHSTTNAALKGWSACRQQGLHALPFCLMLEHGTAQLLVAFSHVSVTASFVKHFKEASDKYFQLR